MTPGVLEYKNSAVRPTLLLPSLLNLPPQNNSTDRPYTIQFPTHFSFLFAAYPGLSRAKLEMRALADLTAIETTFPSLPSSSPSSSATILAMAAWFSTLCRVDDLVETLHPDAVPHALLDSISILRDGYIPFHESVDVCLNDVIAAADVDTLNRVRKISYAFRNHLMSLLPRATYQKIVDGVADTWAGIVAETYLRSQGKVDGDAYLEVRTRTWGLAPFFTLLAACNNTTTADTLDGCCAGKSGAMMEELEGCVKVAVGVQNDLVGLEKDIRTKDSMNYVLVSAAAAATTTVSKDDVKSVDDVKMGIERAVEVHDRAVEMATSLLAEIEREGGEAETGCARQLVAFVGRHFEWAVGSRRYKMA
ncbi:hypothetical protein LTS18_006888 [Coniosporium uncinatum]|uniref:Uncharacterized protein n=1 Tax=Coniosporium uncinatum TaxID=93489 RepID=A0ACC3DAM2_9PEZI|nr:hypothetical protein LTS18_006888 [Coniosporium uncinatum]